MDSICLTYMMLNGLATINIVVLIIIIIIDAFFLPHAPIQNVVDCSR